MNNKDFNIHDIATLLTSSKSSQWRKDIIDSYSALFNFMKNNALLLNVEPFDDNGELKLDLIVKKSNVTEDAISMYKKVIPGWFDYLARSTVENKYENVSRLEKGLAKIRETNK
ncbi:hypothetical protein KWI08_19410 [Morganella morganii]|uniref:hypothetical protein n=1 Tax=Morganella morganii TaxID=582 RepID=UPI0021D1E101|nr:hypothetical protein [Morganella morganii]MCU6276055.1 hypothetical protein [Morganella morganii]